MENISSYQLRISNDELQRKLEASGALLIRGMKASGKTMSARQFSSSALALDQDMQLPILMDTAPKRLLIGR